MNSGSFCGAVDPNEGSGGGGVGLGRSKRQALDKSQVGRSLKFNGICFALPGQKHCFLLLKFLDFNCI